MGPPGKSKMSPGRLRSRTVSENVQSKSAAEATQCSVTTCHHIGAIGTITRDELVAIMKKCRQCDQKACWLCLHSDCLQQESQNTLCGSKADNHVLLHHQTEPDHSVYLHLANHRIFCLSCNEEVDRNRNMPALPIEIRRALMPMKRGRMHSHGSAGTARSPEKEKNSEKIKQKRTLPLMPSTFVRTRGAAVEKFATQNRPIMKEMEDGFEDEFPKGLTGLRNLINTCYFNAAIQVLSNCPPFADFFRDKGDLRPYAVSERDPIVSQLTAQLIQRLWSPARLYAVSPDALLLAVRERFPQFRGYSQQDSQELIRCLLELIHRELGQPVYAYEDYASIANKRRSSSVSSNGSDQFETADSGWSSDGDSPSTSNDSRIDEGENNNEEKRPTYKYKKPISWRSIVTDVFDGQIESSVKCLTCQSISTSVETFQDLSLPIPSKEQLDKLLDYVEEDPTSTAFYQERQRTSWWSWLTSLFVSPPTTLQDCLATFFSPDRLVGDDMYSCEKCKKLRNGIKTCKISRAPEFLCIHVKRFRHDAFASSKVSTKIQFPLVDLDITPFCTDDVSAQYDLCGFITHEGSGVDSGHYLAYCRNEVDGNWYEYDDSTVTKLDSAYVLTKEAYVLFYQKRTMPRIEAIRENVAAKLAPENVVSTTSHTYISTEWLNRLNTFSEPGPISNFSFLCEHGHILPRRSAHIGHLCTAIPTSLANELYFTFGGGPRVDQLHYCLVCESHWQWLSKKRRHEKTMYKELDDEIRSIRYAGNHEVLYECYLPQSLVSKSWFHSWEVFITNSCAEPPGVIDNSVLLTTNNDGNMILKQNSNAIRLFREQFLLLQKWYGGGPEVFARLCQPTEDELREGIARADLAIAEARKRLEEPSPKIEEQEDAEALTEAV